MTIYNGVSKTPTRGRGRGRGRGPLFFCFWFAPMREGVTWVED